MSKLKLNITYRAKADIRLITNHIAKDNKSAARAMSVYLYKICRDLAKFPDMGTIRADFTYKDFRFFIIKKRYVIAYKIDGDNLFISRVLTTYQDICALL